MHYKGFTIKRHLADRATHNYYYQLHVDKQQVSVIALATPKAAKNVIDTYLKRIAS